MAPYRSVFIENGGVIKKSAHKGGGGGVKLSLSLSRSRQRKWRRESFCPDLHSPACLKAVLKKRKVKKKRKKAMQSM